MDSNNIEGAIVLNVVSNLLTALLVWALIFVTYYFVVPRRSQGPGKPAQVKDILIENLDARQAEQLKALSELAQTFGPSSVLVPYLLQSFFFLIVASTLGAVACLFYFLVTFYSNQANDTITPMKVACIVLMVFAVIFAFLAITMIVFGIMKARQVFNKKPDSHDAATDANAAKK
jgi:hypothetical protein